MFRPLAGEQKDLMDYKPGYLSADIICPKKKQSSESVARGKLLWGSIDQNFFFFKLKLLMFRACLHGSEAPQVGAVIHLAVVEKCPRLHANLLPLGLGVKFLEVLRGREARKQIKWLPNDAFWWSVFISSH